MVINSGGWFSRLLSFLLSFRVSFPVYEDGYATSTWETLNGAKDDILVYDRCGYLAYHVRMPYSFLDWTYVEMAIRSTHNGTDPCNCTLPNSPTISSSGVEPNVPSTGVKGETNKASNIKRQENARKKRHTHLVKRLSNGRPRCPTG